ncbi:hypothetical protein [Rickettsia hoogstraalii]|nr:hypothetical protein [Rickettsia hoogstraalii]
MILSLCQYLNDLCYIMKVEVIRNKKSLNSAESKLDSVFLLFKLL